MGEREALLAAVKAVRDRTEEVRRKSEELRKEEEEKERVARLRTTP